MRPFDRFQSHRADIRRIVAAHHGTNPRVFGSVARGDDDENSDLDILVDRGPRMSLVDLVDMEDEITVVTGVKTDVMESHFTSKRLEKIILAEAKPV